MEEPSLWARALGRVAYELTLMRPFLPTYAHLIASALFPIYAGAHASLTRPSSAAKPTRRKNHGGSPEDADDEEEEEEHKMEGLAPSDALMMPLFAGCTLAGLYFLIKWLKDPAILNKILNWYFALFGVVSVARLVTDMLDMGHSLIFPRRYTRGGVLYHVEQSKEAAIPVSGTKEQTESMRTPLPGFLSYIPLSLRLRKLLWADRAMPGQKWTLRLYIHRLFAGKLLLGPHGLVGAITSLAALSYFNFVDKPWYLTNLIGLGFSYSALQLMSPTTFGTGSLILGALFFYDIFFVFYTPMMVTVAQSLDAPIKLVFPRPSRDAKADKASYAMLGLGDVVLPGIMIGLALRFDLFLFYLRQQKRVPASDDSPEVVEKPKYFSLAGRWSDHFWTHSVFGRPLWTAPSSKSEQPFTFPKIYFTASLTGYILGMLTTLGVMHIYGHAQPALLYLVPGVVGSLWLTALVRGELGAMWNFSEAAEDEEEAHATNESAGGKSGKKGSREGFFSMSDKRAQEMEDRARRALKKHVQNDTPSDDEAESLPSGDSKNANKIKAVAGHRSNREVFSFSLEAPYQLKHPRSLIGAENNHDQDPVPLKEDGVVWATSSAVEKEVEGPAGKRVRLG